MGIRECPHCDRSRVLHLSEIPRVYYGMSPELKRALESAQNNPYVNHLCTACKRDVKL